MKKILFAAVLCAAMWSCCENTAHRPVNKNASKEARELLSFLYSIKGEYTLAGQHNFISGLERYDSVVYAMTGKRPVIWGSDFSFNALGDNQRDFLHCGPMNLNTPWGELKENSLTTEQHRQNLVDQIKLRHAEGRIITLMWHCCWPTSCDSCNGDEIWTWAAGLPSEAEWRELTTDGTPLNEAWKRQVDGVAGYLKQLQDAGIPVLWRPYHEMNGVWFWWCNKPGPEGFAKLWRMMYDRYTNYHGLNNLLWVWNTNAPRDIPGDEAFPYADFFPGTEYVDVLAADVYKSDYKQSHHDQLLELGGGKLIALGEVGALPTVEQYEAQPQWSWFMPWGYFINNQAEQMNAIYHHPRTLTLDRIEMKNGKYTIIK
jgi:mannan endo-1,4-beta-mannosidase